ncbi:putative sulfurylase large subunit (molybdopterin cytosine dinucleotide biosynthesis) [Neorhizobium sp. R1-B]|uniref:XdhC family protein n=1 Tax=unclassified Neorhizobium TaxID=2629175 RepID=UPI000DD65B4D|nr:MULTISPECIES: XdhC family protein [unclassified Neorhizobium]TCV64419.1 putative sulfurylase large subunit (molybdopterin cytosine dinucleotide biosynthesis) [Neorhizobium sp. S3-V5DH]TDX74141.1 putative sulfurylase large subunit (molybdopterin cytosine dinucleotide biosynthesis) [Neorhizobium sp. R1-B]
MELQTLARLNAARQARKAAVVATDLSGSGVRLILEGEPVPGPLGEEVAKAFRSGKATTVEMDGRALFLNVHLPPPRIVVIGAVHISQALARLAPVAGYDLTIIDPRTAFATEERFGGVELVADWPEDVLKEQPLDAYTALAAVTHDPKIDDFPLSEALRAGCFYVGALGSRKTHAKRVERLKEMGRTDEEIARIAAPIGLDIGAASPAEIALATLAQIVQAFRRRNLVTDG